MSAFFVTATGTDIGKTFVTAGLIRSARNAVAIKPVMSGYDPARTRESDAAVLLDAMGAPATEENIATVSPWRFAAPLSPDMAAARENRTVDFAELVQFSRDAIARARGPLFIEGVGGVMVPLDHRHTVLDWIAELKLPVILVTGSYLGTLSHTLTAVDALRRRGAAIVALIVNESDGSSVSLGETLATLSRFVSDAPIATLPRFGAGGDGARAHAAFHELASACGIDRA